MTTFSEADLARFEARKNDPAFKEFAQATGAHLEKIWSKISFDQNLWQKFYHDPAGELRAHGLLGTEHAVLDEPAMVAGIQDIMGSATLPEQSDEDDVRKMSCRKCKWVIAIGIAVILGVAVCSAVVLSGGELADIAAWISENYADIRVDVLAGIIGTGIWQAAKWICKHVLESC